MSESITDKYIKFGVDSFQNMINVNSYFPLDLVVDENTHNAGNIINAIQVTHGLNGGWIGLF